MACVTISRAIVVLPLPGAPLRMRQSFRPSNTALSILSSSDRPHDVILLHSLSRVQFGNSSKVDIDNGARRKEEEEQILETRKCVESMNFRISTPILIVGL